MNLRINKKVKLSELFPPEPNKQWSEDKASYNGPHQLLQWEKRLIKIIPMLEHSDYREGVKYLIELAEDGCPAARRLLSDMYIEGTKVPLSLEKAVEWERKAETIEALIRRKNQIYII